MTTTYPIVTTTGELSDEIRQVDLASQADGGGGVHYVITVAAVATLTESADISAINLAGSDTLTINGQGASLNGAEAYRGLFAYSGIATIENLTIENCVAKGGAGGSTGSRGAGGGGAGLGGGLFVANNPTGGAAPANVVLDDVIFESDSAVGGAGGARSGSGVSGGGGGLGGEADPALATAAAAAAWVRAPSAAPAARAAAPA
jgi:hypothetical protein